ncbi:MAG TPA: ABC-2 transporter permease [Clostridia bacterium]|nr:ABC-2 transporter permease [Clostridia bacterium]
MIKIIKKELKLVLMPIVYIFTSLSALVLIPNYPAWVGLFYCLIPTQIILSTATANKDMEFTSMLPVTRDDIVLARHIDLTFIELLQLLFAIPFAIIANVLISPNGNLVGIDPNIAFFGLSLICYSVYNLIFLPWHFRSGYKAVPQMLVGMVAFGAMVGIFETLINLIPVLKNTLDTLDPAYIGIQLAVLGIGIIFFVLALIISYKKSVKNFRKVNL